MRRSRTSSAYRALGQQHGQARGGLQSASSVIRSFDVDENPARPVRPSPLTASAISDMPLDLVDRIRSFPLFMSAPDEFLAAIGAHLRPQIHAPHDRIITEGDEARSMYWLVRGIVAVTSRDEESVYAELKPGAFFGEIGVLMNVPRTANIVARTKCLLVVLKKEDLQAELPKFPEMEKAIRQEALERLAILKKKRQEGAQNASAKTATAATAPISREAVPGAVSTGETGALTEGSVSPANNKKRKSPSPGVVEDPAISGSALGSAYVNVRKTLRELPLFSTLPPDIMHFLGLNVQPKSYPPFTNIVHQGDLGNDIYFIVHGEAEVVQEPLTPPKGPESTFTRPRLRAGQYFGEVASLGLSQRRTATVRSVTDVECLMVPGDVLEELWHRCPPEVRSQVEETARQRYHPEVEMTDVGTEPVCQPENEQTPSPSNPIDDEAHTRRPSDPDPFLSVDMENIRNRRRNSLAPPTSQTDCSVIVSGIKVPPVTPAPPLLSPISIDDLPLPKRPRIVIQSSGSGREWYDIPDRVLVGIFRYVDLPGMLRLRRVCRRWRHLLTNSPELCTHVNLSRYNRRVDDAAVINVLAPFIGPRPVEIDINDCFHLTDEGFRALWRTCGKNVRVWRMRSVWDVSASQILEMCDSTKTLEEVDWSNCRKVGDNLLIRAVGWVVPNPPPSRDGGGNAKNVIISPSQPARPPTRRGGQPPQNSSSSSSSSSNNPQQLGPGTVVGCPNLRRLNLSYCKHITDRSMAHLAHHASHRLQSLTLTRCTSVSDAGFQAWAPHRFTELTHLSLADCTFLSDNAVVALVSAAKKLTHLDLSFCCALSDTATEVVALGLPRLRELRMAFCGSAVSDASLGCVALHLNDLRGLSVRGCVRVTGHGVENVLEGCGRLEWLDVSQCKNLGGWLAGGGVERWGFDERTVRNNKKTATTGSGCEENKSKGKGKAGNKDKDGDTQMVMGEVWVPPGAKVAARNALVEMQAHAAAAGGRGSGGSSRGRTAPKPLGPGPVLRPVIPPRGAPPMRSRKPVRFVVEKGPGGDLR